MGCSWGFAEVAVCLSPCWAAEQDGVRSLRLPQGQLIKGQALTPGLADPHAGLLSEAQCADGHPRDAQQPDVVRNSPHDSSDFAIFPLHLPGQTRHRQGTSQAADGHQPLVHNLVEAAIRPPGQELVELDEEPKIRIGRFHHLPAWFLRPPPVLEVDPHCDDGERFLDDDDDGAEVPTTTARGGEINQSIDLSISREERDGETNVTTEWKKRAQDGGWHQQQQKQQPTPD